MGEEILTTGAGAEQRAVDQLVAWSARGNPAQMALLECSVFEVFFGGARGGGKTDGMLGEWANHADRYVEHAIGLMLRRTRTELIETIERSRAIYSLLGWKYNETDKMWRATNGARLRFAYLERDADADQYQGHSYTRLYVEEIGTFPSPAPIALANAGHDTRALQAWLGHKNIQHTVRYTELAPHRFKDFWH